MIENELKKGFKTIDNELTQAVQAVLDAWLEFRNRIGGFDGAAIAAPVNALLDEVTGRPRRQRHHWYWRRSMHSSTSWPPRRRSCRRARSSTR